MFLAGNIGQYGFSSQPDLPYSCDVFYQVDDADEVVCVWGHCANGNLLIVGDSCVAEEVLKKNNDPPLCMGSYGAISQLAKYLGKDEKSIWRDSVLVLNLEEKHENVEEKKDVKKNHTQCSHLGQLDDFAEWDRLYMMMGQEMDLPRPDENARRADYDQMAREKRVFFSRSLLTGHMCAISAIGSVVVRSNHNHDDDDLRVGIVVAVFCTPQDRRQGYARSCMRLLIDTARRREEGPLKMRQLMLFTEREGAAMKMYKSLGFEEKGEYCLL